MPRTPVETTQNAAAAGAKYADASSSFLKAVFTRWDEFVAALGTPYFYAQLLLIGMALAIAWLSGTLIVRRVKRHLKNHPPRRIDVEFLLKPVSLVRPLLGLLFLSVVKPFADGFAANSLGIAEGAIQICLAYIAAKCVLLVVLSRPVAYFIAGVLMVLGLLHATGFMSSTAAYLDAMSFTLGQFHISVLGIIKGLIILVVVFWIAALMSRTLESYLRRSSRMSYTARELTVKFFKFFVYFTALIITLSSVGFDLTAFAVFGGALGVGIGLGLQKISGNFVSGLTLLMEKSIQLGDLIEVGNFTGWVRQLNIRYTLLEGFDGREVLIPNEELASTRVINWTHSNDRARIEVDVTISYASDPGLARQLMIEAAHEHRRCLKDPEPSCWMREFSERGINFLLIFWIADVKEGRLGPKSDVMFSIYDKFRANNIEIPFPQRDVWIRNSGVPV